ncbi:hypothetical protein [Magnetococcus sp. PR-3]|uniref:hypothetical protein n=1 Tax=Magnetococcus sp. PR-3 TaxID=3120355 RepID=UPI002FCDF827
MNEIDIAIERAEGVVSLARLAGTSHATLIRWKENGRCKQWDAAKRIATVTGTSLLHLMDGGVAPFSDDTQSQLHPDVFGEGKP